MNLPSDRSYTAEHEWLGDTTPATVGITAFASEALGDVVYVDLPAAGTVLAAGDICGEIESTKSVSDLYAPASGEVVAVNGQLHDDPGLVNRDPYGDGWLFTMNVEASGDLLDADAYRQLLP